MIPGPDQVIACPKCQALSKYLTLISGNTFGARLWTDGKQVAPMLPRPPAVSGCQGCGQFFWLKDARDIGTFDDVDSVPYVKEPSEAGYYEALRSGLAKNPGEERILRIPGWWRGNDAFREVGPEETGKTRHLSGESRANLGKLLPLLDELDGPDLLMKAEIHRELGDFERALELLKRVTSTGLSGVVRSLESLCEAQDTCVRELRSD